MQLRAIDYDRQGRRVRVYWLADADTLPGDLLPEQRRELAEGRSVSLVSWRGRTDLAPAFAPPAVWGWAPEPDNTLTGEQP
jgi:hypothetical protein